MGHLFMLIFKRIPVSSESHECFHDPSPPTTDDKNEEEEDRVTILCHCLRLSHCYHTHHLHTHHLARESMKTRALGILAALFALDVQAEGISDPPTIVSRTPRSSAAEDSTTRLPRGGSTTTTQQVTISSLPATANALTKGPPLFLIEHEPLPRFEGASYVALANFVLFALRPDPDVPWPARLPRLLWEGVLYLHLRQACRRRRRRRGSFDVHHPVQYLSSTYYVWLALLTGTTGLVDLFVWAPLFGAMVSWESCQGGGWLKPKMCQPDLAKGYSRLLVTVQAVVGGLVYLQTALQATAAGRLVGLEERRQREAQQRAYYNGHDSPVYDSVGTSTQG
jgi:hypothetical protein